MNNKPIIGIVSRPGGCDEFNYLMTVESYRNAIIMSGGNPIAILPPQLLDYNEFSASELNSLSYDEKNMIVEQIKLCDGILMPGGNKRYEYDRFITQYCLDKDIPILGICLGMQLLATHINRDTLVFTDEEFSHSKPDVDMVHMIELDKNSILFDIIGEEEIMVNSRHRYKITETGDFSISGYSFDRVIEAIEDPTKKFAIGVQWHPENLMDTEPSKRLFKRFIESCRE